MGHDRTRSPEHGLEPSGGRPQGRHRTRTDEAARTLLQLQRDPLSLAPTQLRTVQRHVGHDALAGILGTLFDHRPADLAAMPPVLTGGHDVLGDLIDRDPGGGDPGCTGIGSPAGDTGTGGSAAAVPTDGSSTATGSTGSTAGGASAGDATRGATAGGPVRGGSPVAGTGAGTGAGGWASGGAGGGSSRGGGSAGDGARTERSGTASSRGLAVQRQQADGNQVATGDGAEITPEEAERRVREARDSAAGQAANAAPPGEGEGGSGQDAGPTDSEARDAAEERAEPADAGGQEPGMPPVSGIADPLAGVAMTPPTDQSTVPNFAELAGPGGRLARYAEEKAWHDAWVAGGRDTGMAAGERAELVGKAIGAGFVEGATGGLAAAVVGQVVKHATKSIPYASGFLAAGEMLIKGQSPLEWGTQQFSAGGKKIAEGWGKLWGDDSDWIDRIEGFIDILDGLNSFIGTISTICFIVAGVLALAGVILAIFGIGAALLTFAGFCAKAGIFLGKVAAIVGIILTALRLIIMAARAAQIMLSDADPETQAKRADSLRRSTSAFTTDFGKSLTNRRLDRMAENARARREAAANRPDQPDAAPPPAAAGQARQQVGGTEERRSLITRGLDAISAGEFSRETAAARQLGQEGWGVEATDQYLPDTIRERRQADRALAAALAEQSGQPPVATPAAAPVPGDARPTPGPGEPGEQLSLPFPDEWPQLRAITAPLPLEAIPDNAPVPQGVAPGAMGTYDPLTSGPGYAPHPFTLESNPPGAPGASRRGGKMPTGVREDAGVFAEHGTAAAIMGEVVPNYEVHGPQGQRRKGHGTRHQPVISVEESTKSAKDAVDASALADIRARKAAGEEVPWIEAVVGGNVRLREAAAQGGSQAPGYQHTKDFLAEIDYVHQEPRHGFQEHRPGQPWPGGQGPLAGADTDAYIDAMFAPFTGPAAAPAGAAPAPGSGAPPPSSASPPASQPPEQLSLPFPATGGGGGAGGAGPTAAPAGVYGPGAPSTAAVPSERTDLVSQWERLRQTGEKEASSFITEGLGLTGEGTAFASANASPEEAAQHRQEWVEQQRQAMSDAHRSMTENLPPPPVDQEAELDQAAASYAELDVEERRLRFQRQEIGLLQGSASEEMTAIQVLQQLMAANRQAIAAEQQELDRRSRAQQQLREKVTGMGQEADDAGGEQQGEAGALQEFVGSFTEMMGLVPSEVVSNSGEGTGAASQIGEGFEQGGQRTADASERSQAAQAHVDELESQTQECRASFEESDADLQALQQLAGANLADARSGRAFLTQARAQADQKLGGIAEAKQRERSRQREAIQVMTSWAQEHNQLRTTGEANLDGQMCALEETIAAQESGAGGPPAGPMSLPEPVGAAR